MPLFLSLLVPQITCFHLILQWPSFLNTHHVFWNHTRIKRVPWFIMENLNSKWHFCHLFFHKKHIYRHPLATGLEKVSFHSNTKEGQCQRMFKLLYNGTHFTLRLCSKFFKLGFSSMWTKNFQMYKLCLEKAEESKIKLPTFTVSWRKQGGSRKTSTSVSLTILILWLCGEGYKVRHVPGNISEKPVVGMKL